MQTKLKAIMALGLLLSATMLCAQSISVKIDSVLNKAYSDGKIQGVILVANEQGIVYKKGFGIANREKEKLNQPATPFFIASLTKPFTALRVMQLIQSGKMNIDDSLAYYFPVLTNKEIRKVTIHQLLSHTSGIPEFLEKVPSEKIYTDQWFIKKLDSSIVDSTAGKFRYCNSAYVLLAHIIEKVTGKSYTENLEASIFKPSGMHHSGNFITGKKVKNIAEGYITKDSVLDSISYLSPAIFPGAGSIYSTAEDLYRFDRVLYTDKLINTTYKDMMFTNQAPGASYGYGWMIRKFPFGKAVYHEGDLPGYTCTLVRALEKKYCIVLLSNNASTHKYKQEIILSLLRILSGNL